MGEGKHCKSKFDKHTWVASWQTCSVPICSDSVMDVQKLIVIRTYYHIIIINQKISYVPKNIYQCRYDHIHILKTPKSLSWCTITSFELIWLDFGVWTFWFFLVLEWNYMGVKPDFRQSVAKLVLAYIFASKNPQQDVMISQDKNSKSKIGNTEGLISNTRKYVYISKRP